MEVRVHRLGETRERGIICAAIGKPSSLLGIDFPVRLL